MQRPDFGRRTQIVVRPPAELTNADEMRVGIVAHGTFSNEVGLNVGAPAGGTP